MNKKEEKEFQFKTHDGQEFPKEVVDNITVYNCFRVYNDLPKMNPQGCTNMWEFALSVAEGIAAVTSDPLVMTVMGRPYSTNDIEYVLIEAENSHLKINHINLIMYPAGFRFRYPIIKKNYLEELTLEIISKLPESFKIELMLTSVK